MDNRGCPAYGHGRGLGIRLRALFGNGFWGVTAFPADQLAHDVTGTDAERPLFATSRGRVLRNLNFRRDCFDPAATRAGLRGDPP